MLNNSQVEYDTIIPNNVSLSSDKKVLKALERWHPGYIDWWKDLGPVGFQDMLVYLRTAINVDKDGWATFDYVKMPEYRWGILLAPQKEGRTIPFGDHKGEPVWQEVPGEYRSMLRRLIVIQGDTEPASIEQQRFLGSTAPSLYDMRNLFQVNVEEGRHLWAMVYLLQKYFGSDGREEANELLKRQSGSEDAPRMLGAFNESTPDWLSFFMFTTFTDRDGKMQLEALAQSGFDPLSRTCRFMLTEEAHHMFVGENGVRRVIKKTCEMMNKAGISDPYDIDKIRELGVIDLPTIQKKINLHYSLSLDLFGSEISTNAANTYTAGVKGRFWETKIKDDLEEAKINFEMKLPFEGFNRKIGTFMGANISPLGDILTKEKWNEEKGNFLPTTNDNLFIESLMKPVSEPGKYADWISAPDLGIDNKPGDFEYVKIHDA